MSEQFNALDWLRTMQRSALRENICYGHCADEIESLRQKLAAANEALHAAELVVQDRESKIQEANELIAEMEVAATARDAKILSMAGGDWDKTCGCSYDRPEDVCAYHSPQLTAANERAASAQKQFSSAKMLIESMEKIQAAQYLKLKELDEAKKTLDSERDANSRLTEELSSAQAQVVKMREELNQIDSLDQPHAIILAVNAALRVADRVDTTALDAIRTADREKVIEECAKACEAGICSCCWEEDAQTAAEQCASDIRALASKPTQDKETIDIPAFLRKQS